MEQVTVPMVIPQHSTTGNTPTSRKKYGASFITANSQEVTLKHLQRDCIIPVFRDNESTISHQEFIATVYEAGQQVFPMETISEPVIRVSHEIKGRIPEAVGKPAKELLEHEKTIYYERIGFFFEAKTISDVISGNELTLSFGGVRAYNQENLYSKKTMEKFKVFIGFKNSVCCNLCISTDGLQNEIKVSSLGELMGQVVKLFFSYNAIKHLATIDAFAAYELSQHQFCQFIGKSRLYQFLPKAEKSELPLLGLNDAQISAIAKSYYEDEHFAADEIGHINLWKMYNLLTGAVKSSYIDSFLERNVNAHQLTGGFVQALNGDSRYKWFLE